MTFQIYCPCSVDRLGLATVSGNWSYVIWPAIKGIDVLDAPKEKMSVKRKSGWDKRQVAFEPSDGKPKGRWWANVGTVTRADGKKYNVFLTFLRRDLDKAARSFGRSSVLIESAPAYRVRFKFEEQPT